MDNRRAFVWLKSKLKTFSTKELDTSASDSDDDESDNTHHGKDSELELDIGHGQVQKCPLKWHRMILESDLDDNNNGDDSDEDNEGDDDSEGPTEKMPTWRKVQVTYHMLIVIVDSHVLTPWA